jgi:hypothetical protein
MNSGRYFPECRPGTKIIALTPEGKGFMTTIWPKSSKATKASQSINRVPSVKSSQDQGRRVPILLSSTEESMEGRRCGCAPVVILIERERAFLQDLTQRRNPTGFGDAGAHRARTSYNGSRITTRRARIRGAGASAKLRCRPFLIPHCSRAKNKIQAKPHERWRRTLSTWRTPATPGTK